MVLTEEDFAQIRQIVQEVVRPLVTHLDILDVKAQNSLLGRADRLKEVPNKQGVLPSQANPPPPYPRTLAHLLVAGNEMLPDEDEHARWNKDKSKALLRFYDAVDSESENEDPTESERNGRSRRRRLRVVQEIGITKSQLNFANMVF